MARKLDRGWAWAVLLGVHVSVVLSTGYMTTLGVFFNEWKDYFETNATDSSWLISLPWLVAGPTSFVVSFLASRFGVRQVAMLGAAINGLATVLGSLTTNIQQLYGCNAVLGVGSAMVLSPATIILTQYFRRRYVLANGLATLGVNVGQMSFPPMMRLLIASYGWRGAMLIIGALQINGVAACALFRPIKPTSDKSPPLGRNQESKPAPDTQKRVNVEVVIVESHSRYHRPSGLAGKVLRFLAVFTNLRAMVVLLVNSLHSMGLTTNLAHLPARSKGAGWSDTQSALLLLVFGVTSAITRSVHGWFVDKGYIDSFTLQLVAICGSAVVTLLNPVSDSYVFLVGYAFVLGAFIGIGVSLLIPNMKLVVTESEVPAALGLMWATFYLFGGVGSIVAGAIFDATGNYVAPFLVGGADFLGAFLLFIVVIIMTKRRSSIISRRGRYTPVVTEMPEPDGASVPNPRGRRSEPYAVISQGSSRQYIHGRLCELRYPHIVIE